MESLITKYYFIGSPTYSSQRKLGRNRFPALQSVSEPYTCGFCLLLLASQFELQQHMPVHKTTKSTSVYYAVSHLTNSQC